MAKLKTKERIQVIELIQSKLVIFFRFVHKNQIALALGVVTIGVLAAAWFVFAEWKNSQQVARRTAFSSLAQVDQEAVEAFLTKELTPPELAAKMPKPSPKPGSEEAADSDPKVALANSNKSLREFADANGQTPEALNALARIVTNEIRLKNLEAAKTVAQELTDKSFSANNLFYKTQGSYLLSQIQAEMGDLPGTITTLDKLLAEPKESLGDLKLTMQLQLVKALLLANNRERAQTVFADMQQNFADRQEVREARALLYVQQNTETSAASPTK